MPVNYATPAPAALFAVAGVRLGIAEAGIRKPGRRDLTLITLEPGSTVAAVFTQNRFCAAPVRVCQRHLEDGAGVRALLINTGIANAGTGESGIAAALSCCEAVAQALGLASANQVMPFSTGVILEPLPVERLVAGLPRAVADLAADNWHAAALAIMTTDTVAKAASRQIDVGGRRVTVTGMSKGAGMIRPNMATMLGFVATDAAIPRPLLEQLTRDAADQSFNCITVDGDTSTNDSFVVIATGKSGVNFDSPAAAGYAQLRAALFDVARELAQAIVRDGEGATKFISVVVSGARDTDEARQIAYAVAHSPLVKTAFFASDPNLGRILAAIGRATDGHDRLADLDVDRVRVWLASGDDVVAVAAGGGRVASYREADGARVMQNAEIEIRIDAGRGDAAATVWTCDFSYDYVKINADYRS